MSRVDTRRVDRGLFRRMSWLEELNTALMFNVSDNLLFRSFTLPFLLSTNIIPSCFILSCVLNFYLQTSLTGEDDNLDISSESEDFDMSRRVWRS